MGNIKILTLFVPEKKFRYIQLLIFPDILIIYGFSPSKKVKFQKYFLKKNDIFEYSIY